MASTAFFTKNPIGLVGVPLVTYALVIIGLYFLAYAPMEAELVTVRQEGATARDDAAAARQIGAELDRESAAHLARISDLESLLSEVRETGAALAAVIPEREAELDLAQRMQTELVDALQQEISDGQIRVERMLDSLRVDMINEILFDSCEATLKPDGMEVLGRLGEVLEQATDKLIVVQGHTDSVQIGCRCCATPTVCRPFIICRGSVEVYPSDRNLRMASDDRVT